MKNINIENPATVTTTETTTETKPVRKASKFAATFKAIDAAIKAPRATKATASGTRDNFERAVRIVEEVKTGRTKYTIKGAAKSRPISPSRIMERVMQLIAMGVKGDAIVLNVPDLPTRCAWSKVEVDIMHVAREMGVELISVRSVFGFTPEQEARDTVIAEKRANAAAAEADVAVARAAAAKAAVDTQKKKQSANGNGAAARR
jgi:hypothetical protein